MNFGLNGKWALVSGGTHGIGEAIALGLAAEGCKIITFSRSESRVVAMRDKLRVFGPDHVCSVADVFDSGSFDRMRQEIELKCAGADIVINNIGGGGRWGSEELLDTHESVWNEVYDKNFMACLRYTKMFLPYMLSRNWGRVIAITSIYGKQAGGRPWFNVAKSAQTVFIKNLSLNKRYARANITFNSVAPGAIWIPNTGWEEMQDRDPLKFNAFIEDHCPRGRMGTPKEVADLVVFLCSENASLISGASISVDGGESVCF
jgi:3-oxoacyl-[acyl-carrier protein] reductase